MDTAYRTSWIRRIEPIGYGVSDLLGTAYWATPVRCIGSLGTAYWLIGYDAPIVKLHDIPKGVLVWTGLIRVWRNPMCDPLLRRSDNTVMSIYDFLYMPSLDKVTVWEEPHGLDTSILGRVADHTSSPAPQKASTGPEISTNVAKKTRSNKKGSGAGSSGQATGDEVEQTDDGILDDDDQHDGSEFAMEGIENLNNVSQDKEVKAHAELFGGGKRATRANFRASHAPNTQPLDADAGIDEIASDGDVDPYYEARVGSGSESPPYTRDDWEEIHGVNLGLRKKELYKDPKVCRTALDQFPTPTETHRLRELSLVEFYDRMSTQTIKRQSADLKQQNESTICANKEVSRNERDTLAMEKAKIEEELVGTKSYLEHRERQAKEIQGSIASFFQSDFTPLVRRFLKSGEFNRAFVGVLNTAISVGVERGLHMDRTNEEFRGLSQRVAGFIPDAKEKFDRVVAAFPNTTFLFLDKTSSATASLRANTYVRHSTSSSGTFDHTSTPEHLKKKKKSVEKRGLSAA
ncbi:hypothetical protein Tco_1354849 [Tanacetum coccineum]